MNVSILFPDSLPDNLRDYGIVMPDELRDILIEYQQSIGAYRHFVSPVLLADGRYAINADILTETHERGIFKDVGWITEEMLSQCVVIPWDRLIRLLPPSDGDEA
jgi:hypothetical protein